MTNLLEKNETALLLIDNNCCSLNLNNIKEVIQSNDFSEITHIKLNNEIIDKNDIINFLPINTSSKYLNLSVLKWPDLCTFSNVIFLTNKPDLKEEIKIVALFYRIFTSKSMIALVDGEWKDLNRFSSFYPYFLTIYQVEKCKSFKLNEISDIDDMNQYRENLIKELNESVKEVNELKIEIYNNFFNYILNKGKDWKSILNSINFSNGHKEKLKDLITILEAKCLNYEKFKFYDSKYSYEPSLITSLQITLPKIDETKIYVYKTVAADYNFRNFKLKNVAITTSNDELKFVLPIYKDDEITRNTIRFLVMFSYNVSYSNYNLTDLIILYLFMKVTRLDDDLIKTRFKNITMLFLKQHYDVLLFLKLNRSNILKLKKYFKELNEFKFESDLFCLFDNFIKNGFNLNDQKELITTYEIVYSNEELIVSNENRLEILPDIDEIKYQKTLIEINETNWPSNKNFKCDDTKLQFNSSLPYFICIKSYNEFLEKINSISWMKTLAKLTDKFVLKGGALFDLLSDSTPHDYDIMNIGMSNEEFLYDFWPKFVDELKPKSIEFNPYPVTTFKVRLTNNDLIEVVLNADISLENLVESSYMPDQICYWPRSSKLYANEYTLWALNYGYCQLKLNKHPKTVRLSHKLNKIGFNFYYIDCFKSKTKFLKERLERHVWSISEEIWNKDFSAKTNPEFKVKLLNDVSYLNKRLIYPNVKSFMKDIENRVNKNQDEENDLRIVEFIGGVVLPEKKVRSAHFSYGIDWSV